MASQFAVDAVRLTERPPPSPSSQWVRANLHQERAFARAWGSTVPDGRRAAQAGAFGAHALATMAELVAPRPTPSCLAHRDELQDREARRLAERIGRQAATLPLVEGLLAVTGLYPSLLPDAARGRLGAFYTPPALIERLLDHATAEGAAWKSIKVLDPAAGGGAFLLGAADRMRRALGACAPARAFDDIVGRLQGMEIDPQAAYLAQAALEIFLGDLANAAGRDMPELVRVCDSLEEPAAETFDLVVGNPPYGRVTLNADQRSRYGRGLKGHANLYGLFTDIALRWTKINGLIAYVTPTSFLAGQYYAALRRLLAIEAPPACIDFVHARRGVFEDVLQETMLAVYRKGAKPTRTQVHYLHVIGEHEARTTRNGTIGLPSDPGEPWLAPREPGHAALIARAESMIARLSDWGYSVSTGPLVWNRFKAQLRFERVEERVYPLLWAEAVTSDGRFVFRAKKRNHAPFFKIEPGDDLLLVQAPCVLLQRTTAKEQTRRLIAAELPDAFVRLHGGVIIENHLNMIKPVGHPKVSPSVVAAILNTHIVDQLFRCMNGSVAVSAFELNSLPLPDVAELTELRRLVAGSADRTEIEFECRRLYYGRA